MNAITLLRSTFVAMASSIALANTLPGIQTRFILYGPRNSSPSASDTKSKILKTKIKDQEPRQGVLLNLLDRTSEICVPHAWFCHFYILSCLLSAFWAFQIATHGTIFTIVAASCPSVQAPHMTLHQVVRVWAMMAIQGIRRLYESLRTPSSSNSSMWVAHWFAGLVFYTCMSAAVWIEGIPAIMSESLSLQHLQIFPPDLKSFIGIPMFICATGIQYDCHSYLASLQKYSLPEHPIFQLLICPHYFAECLIYLSLAISGAPDGSFINRTILCALCFVIINLGITAQNTRQWYAEKFGVDKIKGRWTMVPYVW